MTPDASRLPAAFGSLPPVEGEITFSNPTLTVGGNLYQAAQQIIHIASEQDTQRMATRWTRPAPPALARDVVLRREELDQVVAALRARQTVAITGQAVPGATAVRAAALAVQGMAGAGKTTLAHLLVQAVADDYPDGVLWEELPQDFARPEQAQPVLQRWAACATDFFDQPANANRSFLLEPAAVRSLLGRHPRLLVVLDNVWALEAIAPLRAACPPGAHLVVTTRLAEVAHGLQAGLVEVGLLRDADARALFELRLGWSPSPDAETDQWAVKLMQTVGNHALGLDVALGVLRRYGAKPAAWQPVAVKLMAEVRSGVFDRLALPGDPGHHVKGVLYFSYEKLRDAETQRRFRGLGAFALEADFTTALAAAVWACDTEAAYETLTDFANAALLDRKEKGWRQHGLLRSFALALLRDAGEQPEAAAAHARAYAAAMRTADDAQRSHELLPAMPQLRHAMTWALAHDLALALDIAADCAALQKQFELIGEAGAWSEQLLAAAQARAAPEIEARAWQHRANTLYNLATLPGEDRRQRLDDALVAYSNALRHYRADTAPLVYAMTRHNQATLLHELAALPGEDRRQRLDAALTTFDETLRHVFPDIAPLDYAMTQNNRGLLLRDLATLPGEDRRRRLDAALAAYDDALRFRRPENTPLAYAQTQNNRANLLCELATLPGEDRRQRLDAALTTFDEALRFRRPEYAPLDYAQTQNNRANLLRELATLPGEDRRQHLDDALAAYDEALRFLRPENVPLAYATTQNNRASLLRELATLPGEDRRQRLFEALATLEDAQQLVPPDNFPLEYAVYQDTRATVLVALAAIPGDDRLTHLQQSLRCSAESIAIFDQYQNEPLRQEALTTFVTIKAAFGSDFAALWQPIQQDEKLSAVANLETKLIRRQPPPAG